MTMGAGQSKEGAKYFAEVFTPDWAVFRMILIPELRDVMTDETKTILDPAAGQGQFGCSELVWRMFYTALDKSPRERVKCVLTNLANIYSLELQAKNCDWCKRHLLDTLYDAYEFFFGEYFPALTQAIHIIQARVIQCNSLEWIAEHTPEEYRSKEYSAQLKEMAKKGHISKECVGRILTAKSKAQTSLF